MTGYEMIDGLPGFEPPIGLHNPHLQSLLNSSRPKHGRMKQCRCQ